jgi:Ser/Thr protein kinase RdoA (MazF antagonist)
MPEVSPLTRIAYTGPIETVLSDIVNAFQLSPITSYSVIPIGYEDCNIRIDTADKKYLAKIFSTKRTPEIIARYSNLMTKVINANIRHPTLHKTRDNNLVFTDKQANSISLVLMDFIEGTTYLEKGEVPTPEELQSLLEDACRRRLLLDTLIS